MPFRPASSRPTPGCTSGAPRLLFYSHDGFGLGHLRRNLKLATRLVEELPDASALLVAGLPGNPAYELPGGIDFVKLPSIRKADTNLWRARHLRVPDRRLRAMRGAMLSAVFESFEPDLVVVDYLPLGVWGELRRPLTDLRAARPRTPVVLGLRDVLDSPRVTRRAWRADGHDEAVSSLYDYVHVYGDRSIFDTAAAYGLDELAPGRVTFTGYVCPDPGPIDRAEERREIGLEPEEELLLFTAGGGGDAFPMARLTALAGCRLAERGRRIRTLVVAGPIMDSDSFAELERLVEGAPVVLRRWRHRLDATIATASVVVTMAAYNTLTEAVGLHGRVVSLPRPGPSAEQTLRARLFADRGLVRTIDPTRATPDQLADLLEACLDGPPSSAPRPRMDGLARATALLRGLVVEPGSARPAGAGAARLA